MKEIKRENAFTLVELLGVFTLIGVILLVVVPNVTQLLTKSKGQDYERFLNDIYLATEAYIQGKGKEYSTLDTVSGKAFVQVRELVDNGYLTSTKVNPQTNQKINLDATVVALKTPSGNITYDFVNSDITINAYKKTGLLLSYSIDSKPTTIWKDQSGSELGNDGQLMGFTANNGFQGNSVYLDGTNYILSNVINPVQVTLSTYIMVPEFSSAEQVLMSNYEGGGYGFVVDQSGNRKIAFQINVNGTYYQINSTKNYETNRYYQLVGTYDGTTMKFYLDGVLQGTKTVAGNITAPQNSTHFMVGGNPNGTVATTKTKSYVSSVKIYNHALTEQEIMNDYQLDKARYSSQQENYVEGLLAQYDSYSKPMNNVWNDLTGNGKHATMSGFNNTVSSGWNQFKLTLDGIDDYIQTPNVLTTNKNYTIQIVFQTETTAAWADIMTFNSGNVSNDMNGRIEIVADLKKYYWYGPGPIPTGTSIFEMNNKIPATITMSVGNEKTIVYVDNEVTYQGATQEYNNGQYASINFGKRIEGGNMNCTIYAIRIYNKALTKEEIMKNHQLDHFRFGI